MRLAPMTGPSRLTHLLLVFAMATIGVAGAAETSKYQTWQDPDSVSDQGGTNDERMQQLLDELSTLVEKADRDRAADPRFLHDLKNLIRTYDWPWRVALVTEDFTDGRVAASPQWTILSGEFQAEWGVGLRSVVQAPQTSGQRKSSSSEGDLAAVLLNQLLKKATDQNQSQPASTEQKGTQARIHVSTPITNAFAVSAEIGSRTRDGRLELGVYQQRPDGAGYRLSYHPGGQPSIELLRVGSRGAAVIDSSYDAIVVNNDSPRTIQWTRDRGGEMVITFDGKEVIRSVDRGLKDPFDGFVLTNLGGDFAVRTVEISGTP